MTKLKLSEVIRRCQTRVDRYDTDLLYYVAGEHFESGDIDLAGRGEIAGSTIGPMFYYGFKPGDFLLVSRNPHLRKASRVDFAGICSEKTFVLETADESILSSEYLPWVLQNGRFWDYAQENRHGSTNFFINWSTLADYVFELPPIEDQKRIATILWAAQSARRNYRKLLKACDDVVKSQFVEMFGDPKLEPNKWNAKPLGEVCATRLGKMLDAKKQTGKCSYPYLANTNVQWFHFDLSDLRHMDFSDDDRIEFELKNGDVLVTEGGEIGRCAIWREELPNCYFQKAVHRVRCDLKVLLPEYFVWCFKMKAELGLFKSYVSQSTIAHLTGKKIKQVPIPLPPLELQQEFADFAASADKSKFAVQKALDELNATTKKILNQELGLGDV